MGSINVVSIAQNVIQSAHCDVEQYGEVAQILSHSPLCDARITSSELKTSIQILESIRSSDRFLALAHSTVISLLDLENIEQQMRGEFWVLHSTLSLNLNVADVAHGAALKAIDSLRDGDSLLLAKSYSLLATSSRNLGDYPSSIANYWLAKQTADSAGNDELR